jgi:hypothetical protein
MIQAKGSVSAKSISKELGIIKGGNKMEVSPERCSRR